MKHLSLGVAILAGFTTAPAVSEESESGQSVEEIYAVRSLRLSRENPTSKCAEERTGFQNVRVEDRFKFQSLKVETATGQVGDANAATVGELIGCFGSTSNPSNFNFYAEGSLGNVKFTGKGECLTARKDFPEPGLNMIRCFLDLADLPQEYIGGHLTTNTINSKQAVGPVSDPPGYVQPSIAVIRLWKTRGSRQQ